MSTKNNKPPKEDLALKPPEEGDAEIVMATPKSTGDSRPKQEYKRKVAVCQADFVLYANGRVAFQKGEVIKDPVLLRKAKDEGKPVKMEEHDVISFAPIKRKKKNQRIVRDLGL